MGDRLSIITPTYNRGHLIEKLFLSLENQNNKEFIWIIVDDGSSDNTKDMVDSFINRKTINIKYIYQQNSGKFSALNKAIKASKSELFICVDSDDYLLQDAVEIILNKWKEYREEEDIIGMVAPRVFKDGELSGNEMPKGVYSLTHNELYYKYGKTGETALIFKTLILNQNLIETNEEKFLSEEILYDKLDSIGKLKVINNTFYVMGEYLSDGLTKNYFKLWQKSPENTIMFLKSKYNNVIGLSLLQKAKKRLKTIVQYNIFTISIGKSVFKNTPNKLWSFITILPSYLLYLIKFRK